MMHELPSLEIFPAKFPRDLEEVRSLFREYEAFLQVDLCFQDFEAELAGLPGRYAPPGGGLLLGKVAGKVQGCVAVRDLTPGCCEMKRLYVRPEGRGRGLGRALAERIIEVARDLGYARMRLDTLDRLEEAMRLYRSLGFDEIEAYYENPCEGVVYLEKSMSS